MLDERCCCPCCWGNNPYSRAVVPEPWLAVAPGTAATATAAATTATAGSVVAAPVGVPPHQPGGTVSRPADVTDPVATAVAATATTACHPHSVA
jgi:hypothetical protein